jgi:16S rRNA (adenine1518-N6/adenine1519-N6)-dimethyltransferase
MKINFNSAAEIRNLLKDLKIYLKKRWGQNFLINEGVRNKIVGLLDPLRNEKIWEIGPGIGSITEILINKTNSLTVFEIDKGLVRFLQEYFSTFISGEKNSLSIKEGDFLKTWKEEMKRKGLPDKIIGNLPYSSASAFIRTLIENNSVPSAMVFTVQKELAQRITAKTNTKNYSSFSVLCQYACGITLCGDINPGSFFPRPEVVSTIIKMVPSGIQLDPVVKPVFLKLVKGLFRSRRKTIKNNIRNNIDIKNISKDTILNAAHSAGIDISDRAENYSVSDFIRFSSEICRISPG